ncbi:YtxH domain-containing protein [Alkalibacterium olivapovliticus]|uniref:YtxH-like protein n=1 Tax=Alkalibacterium olivapovliticus TaxID=99907 RepID=A0A2T0W5V0_9LACT|nr:YtxH domain-containing protein [Alkalibacterium olivapovliticus]PRY81428.1 YtxH-like protein [Alkalibacterium olivapovliticus]
MPKVSLTKAILFSAASAFTALLLAPKDGKAFRQDLKEEASKLKDTGEEKAHELVDDFKASYMEAEQELESEQAKLDAKQAKLNQTIEEIERDLALSEAETQDEAPVVDPATASHAVYADDSVGDVRGTPLEPEHDQAIPKDKVDEALHDNYLSDNDDFKLDKNDLDDEEDASHNVNPNN